MQRQRLKKVRGLRDTGRMLRRVTLIPMAIACLALSACEDALEPSATVPGDAAPADVAVIDAWAKDLAKGDVDAAAGYFKLPSVAENGVAIRIESLKDARLFNESLPCGAELVAAETDGAYTIATFRLTERPGPGTCGSGVGARARTAFVIEGGKITEWRRVGRGRRRAGADAVDLA